jgi:hypothetical protein
MDTEIKPELLEELLRTVSKPEDHPFQGDHPGLRFERTRAVAT